MNIAAYTASGIQLGSSRLRSFYVFQSPFWRDHVVLLNPKFSEISSCECLHLQKVLKPRFILLALYARLIGKQVIYDIDDQTNKIKHLISLLFMIFIAHKVVTDTELRKKYLQGITRKKNIEAISGVVDVNQYDLEKNNLLRVTPNETNVKEKSIILWLGNLANFSSFSSLINSDKRFYKYEIVVITDISNPSKIKLNHPNYSIKQWSINWASYLDNETRYFMLLNHHDINDKNSKYKSDVKMTSAIYNLIIPIVSNSHAYSAFAKSINAEFLVFNKDIAPFDILVKMESKDNEFFDDFFKKSIQYIEKNYSSDVVAKKLFNFINKKI